MGFEEVGWVGYEGDIEGVGMVEWGCEVYQGGFGVGGLE